MIIKLQRKVINLEYISAEEFLKQTKEIQKENYRKGSRKLGARPLARRFGVTKTCIYYVVNNMTYKEVV